jgi:hypothetical protein
MVPVMGLPPAMPFTLQETVGSVAPVTAAAKVCVLPKRSEAVAGAMVTVIEEGAVGGGGGGTTAVLAPPVLPAQPRVHAAAARRVRIDSAAKRECVAVSDSVRAFCGRGRMLGRNAGEGPGRRARGGARLWLAEANAVGL